MAEATEHKEIWLEPVCKRCNHGDDRLWCQDDLWTGSCDGCGDPVKATRYVLADS